ncbi:MAG TPA: hydrogenase, partial [Peptococcaceae bacterium]|nr:hydrogenase [Peptococcaceae bacterium]
MPSEQPLLPEMATITKIIEETPDVKTFHVSTANGKPFTPKPGQLAMLSVVPSGEAMFSITWQGDDYLEFSIKRVGVMTDALHELEVGASVGVRGP